jgi:hypothetical protein
LLLPSGGVYSNVVWEGLLVRSGSEKTKHAPVYRVAGLQGWDITNTMNGGIPMTFSYRFTTDGIATEYPEKGVVP